jgi:RimJ/RimL family protein N-acetyltransferase
MEFRAYRELEFDFACALRNITDEVEKRAHRERFGAVGSWRDHYLDYAIDVAGEVIGEIQVRHCDRTMPPGVLEVGLEIAPHHQGKGFGTQALTQVAELMFRQGHHRISGDTDVANIAMQRAFEKAGWRHEGTTYALFVEDGQPHDYLTYSHTKFQPKTESS